MRVWEGALHYLHYLHYSCKPHAYARTVPRRYTCKPTPIYVWAHADIRRERCRYTYMKAGVEDPRSRTAQIAEDQLHLQGGENPLPVLVTRLVQLMAEPPVMPDPSRQAVESGNRTDIGSIGHGQLPFAIRAHRPPFLTFVICLHKMGFFHSFTGIKVAKKHESRNDPAH